MLKTARGGPNGPWPCKKPWPGDCFVQCGGDGLVFPSGHMEKCFTKGEMIEGLADALADPKTYTTAFFEAFPREPDTFIRGEGKTIEEAEAQAWEHLERIKACPGHEYEKRGYTNGAGLCRHCDLFKSKVFEPA